MSRSTAADQAASAIRELIVSGRLNAGESIREDELADRLGISRTPLREALARLEAQGYLVGTPYRGVQVFKPSVEELREIYEIRQVLEVLGARLAAANASRADVARLEELYEALEETSPGRRWVQRNRQFHMTLYAASGRSRLTSLIGTLRDQSELYVRMLVAGGHAAEAQEGHRALLEAIRAGDPEAAERATVEHLGATVRNVMADLIEEED